MTNDPSRLSRRGLTLVELLVSLAIIAILAGITIPVIASIIRGDRVRNASASVQSMIAEARQRAALDGEPRGIRLLADPQNPEYVRQLVFIREADPIATGRAVVTDGLTPGLYDTVEIEDLYVDAMMQLPRGFVTIPALGPPGPANPRYGAAGMKVIRGAIRFEGSGKFHAFSYVPDPNAFPEFAGGPSGLNSISAAPRAHSHHILILDDPLPQPLPIRLFPSAVPGPIADEERAHEGGMIYQIHRPPVPLEGADPLILPRNTIIDLGQLPPVDPSTRLPLGPIDLAVNRLTRLTPRVPLPNIDPVTGTLDYGFDILFAADGRVIANAAVDERVILWIRDELNVQAVDEPGWIVVPTPSGSGRARKALSADSTGGNSLVVLFTRTGFLGTFKPVLRDGVAANEFGAGIPPTTTPADGVFDWAFYFQNVYQGVGVNDQ